MFRSEINMENPTQLRKKLAGKYYDVIINCAGITDLAYCEEHPAEAHAVHEIAVRELAQHCDRHNIALVHITDALAIDPTNVYGVSKAAGDGYIRQYAKEYLIIRTSAMYGPAFGRINWIEKVIKSAIRVKREVKAAAWRSFTPTSARSVAIAVKTLLLDRKWGEYNIVDSGGPVTQAQAAAFIISQIPAFNHLTVNEITQRDRKRPVLPDTTALEPTFPSRLDWKDAVKEYLLERGYLHPPCVLEVEEKATISVEQVWEHLQRNPVPLDTLVAALRQDRANWLVGDSGPGRKQKRLKVFWETLENEPKPSVMSTEAETPEFDERGFDQDDSLA